MCLSECLKIFLKLKLTKCPYKMFDFLSPSCSWQFCAKITHTWCFCFSSVFWLPLEALHNFVLLQMAQLSGKRPIAFVNFSVEKLSKILFWSFYNCFNKNISAFLRSFFNFDFFTYWSCKLIWLCLSLFIFSAALCEFWHLHYLVKIKTWIIFFSMLLIYKLFSGPLLSYFGPSFVLCITDYFWISQHTQGIFHLL